MRKRGRRVLAWGAYVVCFSLVFAPLAQLLLQAWPPRPASLQWRVAMAGLLPNALLLPAVGMWGAFWVATDLGDRVVASLFAATSVLFLVLLIATGMSYSSDFFAMRATVQAEGLGVFDNTGVSNTVSLVLMIVVYATFSWTGVTVSRRWDTEIDDDGRHRSDGTSRIKM